MPLCSVIDPKFYFSPSLPPQASMRCCTTLKCDIFELEEEEEKSWSSSFLKVLYADRAAHSSLPPNCALFSS